VGVVVGVVGVVVVVVVVVVVEKYALLLCVRSAGVHRYNSQSSCLVNQLYNSHIHST
jgi:hypothetical protein